jgi:HD-like signal output (HDOD) protein
MTNKLLKLSNSIYYAQRTKVDTVRKAITVIGFDEIIGIALAMEVVTSFRDKSGVKQNLENLWIHGICVAIASKEMAKHTNPDISGKIFIPGLLHDMGKVILTVYFKDEYQRTKQYSFENNKMLYAVEKMMFGLNHAELSTLLMKRWHFPESIFRPCQYHHDPETASPEYTHPALLINFADYIAHRAGIGKMEYPTPVAIKSSPEKIGVSSSALKVTMDLLRRKEDEIKEFYNIAAQ